jgi:hypothetical protein
MPDRRWRPRQPGDNFSDFPRKFSESTSTNSLLSEESALQPKLNMAKRKPELTKKLWAYIRKNGLQDKKVRTQINADDKLKAVFNGKGKVSMFEMTKLVSGHVS